MVILFLSDMSDTLNGTQSDTSTSTLATSYRQHINKEIRIRKKKYIS